MGYMTPDVSPYVEDVIDFSKTRSEAESEVDGGIVGRGQKLGGRMQILYKRGISRYSCGDGPKFGQLTSREKEIALLASFPLPCIFVVGCRRRALICPGIRLLRTKSHCAVASFPKGASR
jgi:hypothetical protein